MSKTKKYKSNTTPKGEQFVYNNTAMIQVFISIGDRYICCLPNLSYHSTDKEVFSLIMYTCYHFNFYVKHNVQYLQTMCSYLLPLTLFVNCAIVV